MGDGVTVHNCGSVRVRTPDGDLETVAACKITTEDINDDGTVSTPVSGSCSCPDSNDVPIRI